MCFDPNAKIAAVRPSDYGYDVRLDDGTVGNVANDAKDPYYDEVQSYLARTAPSSDPLAGQPAPIQHAPNEGQYGIQTVGGKSGGVTGINDTTTGGRYGLGTRTTTSRDDTRTVDDAPPTAGNIAQAFANVVGFPGSIASMATTQAKSISEGPVAKTVDGYLNGPAPAKPRSGTKQNAESRAHAQANAAKSGAIGNPHTRGRNRSGGGGGGGNGGNGGGGSAQGRDASGGSAGRHGRGDTRGGRSGF